MDRIGAGQTLTTRQSLVGYWENNAESNAVHLPSGYDLMHMNVLPVYEAAFSIRETKKGREHYAHWTQQSNCF